MSVTSRTLALALVCIIPINNNDYDKETSRVDAFAGINIVLINLHWLVHKSEGPIQIEIRFELDPFVSSTQELLIFPPILLNINKNIGDYNR